MRLLLQNVVTCRYTQIRGIALSVVMNVAYTPEKRKEINACTVIVMGYLNISDKVNARATYPRHAQAASMHHLFATNAENIQKMS